jgi:putative hydrolase of the HAD superfamily
MKYKAIIFDLFGTLVDDYDVVGYASVLRETGSLLKLRYDDFDRLWKETGEKRMTGGFKTLEENFEYICKELKEPVKQFDLKLAKMVRYDYVTGSLTPRMYAIETLSELKKSGYKLALISNCSMEPPDLWPQTPLAPFFDVLLFSSICGLRKPGIEIFRLALEKIGVKAEECVYVDDNSKNLTAAAGLGITSVLVTDAEGKEQHHYFEPPVDNQWTGLKIKDLAEVLDILEDA